MDRPFRAHPGLLKEVKVDDLAAVAMRLRYASSEITYRLPKSRKDQQPMFREPDDSRLREIYKYSKSSSDRLFHVLGKWLEEETRDNTWRMLLYGLSTCGFGEIAQEEFTKRHAPENPGMINVIVLERQRTPLFFFNIISTHQPITLLVSKRFTPNFVRHHQW